MFISNDIVSTKIYDKGDDFDFEIVNFPFKMVMLLALRPMVFKFLNLSDLLEHLAMLLTSTLAINCLLRNFSNKAICIINFVKHFLNFNTGNYDLISKFNIGLLEQNFMATKYIY